ncbi:MAG TPA: hypothetical protein VH187_05340 [Scandinavium sp.]|jgi:hypothetical protein|uniref:hypothetical protein n=1 Tax=Scandinavium sp. TaxID=2830653 RepID=UPI002E376C9F|nr:hypothetical protein [Scandinavium sp.]HEX4500584.1 hypothetical protein [Scandinavium sp.]
MNVGVHDGLIDKKHIETMGSAVWLYLWLIRHQTKSTGLVLGGTPITYKKINERLGQKERTVHSWMRQLKAGGYIEVTHTNYKKMRIRILKSKKFNYKQASMNFTNLDSAKNGLYDPAVKAKNGLEDRQKMAYMETENGLFNKSVSRREIEAVKQEAAPPLVDWLPLITWRYYVEMRTKINRPLTPHAIDLKIRELEELKNSGEDPTEVLEQSISNSWAKLYPVKRGNVNGNRQSRKLTGDELTRANLEAAGFITKPH